MRTLELGKHRRARVWIGELPGATYPSAKTLTHTVAASDASQSEPKLAAVEVFVPLGPRSMYGLLGGQWTPGATGQLSVDVSITDPNGPLFADNIAGKGDEVRVGLQVEYAQAVLAGVNLVQGELNTLPAGKLTINCAAHGAIGSCEAVYKHLAAILIKLFNAGGAKPSDEDLVKLFPSTFGWANSLLNFDRREILQSDEAPIISPTPIKSLLGAEMADVFRLNIAKLTADQRSRLIDFIVQKFNVAKATAQAEIEVNGFPIRAADVGVAFDHRFFTWQIGACLLCCCAYIMRFEAKAASIDSAQAAR